MRSEWGATAIELRDQIRLGKADISKGNNYKLSKKYQLYEYPSFRFFKNGKASEYDGGLSKRKIIKWLEKKTAKSQASQLDSEKQYKSFLKEARNDGKVAVIGCYSNAEGDAAKEFLMTAEEDIGDLEFGITSDASVFSDIKVDDGQLLMHHTKTKESIVMTVPGKMAEIKSAIHKNKLPLLRDFIEYDTELTPLTDAFENHIFICTSFSSKKFSSQTDMLANVARDYRGKILFVLVDMDDYLDRYTRILGFLEIKNASAIAPASIKKKGVKKYKPESNEIEENNIRRFLEDYVSGKLEPKKDEL